MSDRSENATGGPAHRLIRSWALAGGVVMIGVVLINTGSILSGAWFGRPFPGDFELTEIGTAIAVFCFLPYCQLAGGNVSADIFTVRAGPLAIAVMSVFANLVAISFAALLLWRMSIGLGDYRTYEEFTAILQIPIWWVFVPALISLALLMLAALTTLRDALGRLRRSS